MEHLSKGEEHELVTMVRKLVSPKVQEEIEACSEKTNIRWSYCIHMALMCTDWEAMAKSMNYADDVEAIAEVETILGYRDDINDVEEEGEQ